MLSCISLAPPNKRSWDDFKAGCIVALNKIGIKEEGVNWRKSQSQVQKLSENKGQKGVDSI